jgi:hypothetical protein
VYLTAFSATKNWRIYLSGEKIKKIVVPNTIISNGGGFRRIIDVQNAVKRFYTSLSSVALHKNIGSKIGVKRK